MGKVDFFSHTAPAAALVSEHNFWWLENTYLAAYGAWSVCNLWMFVKSHWRHVTTCYSWTNSNTIAQQLLFSPRPPVPKKASRRGMLIRKRLPRCWSKSCVASGPTADCGVTWVRRRFSSTVWNFVVQLIGLSKVCMGNICWLVSTKSLVVLCCSLNVKWHHKAHVFEQNLLVLFWKGVGPLEGVTSLEGVGHCGRALRFYSPSHFGQLLLDHRRNVTICLSFLPPWHASYDGCIPS